MEAIEKFVARTRGPVIPLVDEWYPWVYAHHYLRIEIEKVPPELGPAALSLSLDGATALLRRWCADTGEDLTAAAHQLADAYLERWGLTYDSAPEAVVAEPVRLVLRGVASVPVEARLVEPQA